MTWTKIRAFFGAVFAIALIFVLFCAIAAQQGWQIPGVTHVARFLGFTSM